MVCLRQTFIATEALKTQKKYKSRFCASVPLWQTHSAAGRINVIRVN